MARNALDDVAGTICPIHLLYTPCTPPMHPLYTPYTHPIPPLYNPYTPPIQPLYTPYTPPIHPLYTPYTTHYALHDVAGTICQALHSGVVRGGRGEAGTVRQAGSGQGLALVHFSARPEPFLTQNTPYVLRDIG